MCHELSAFLPLRNNLRCVTQMQVYVSLTVAKTATLQCRMFIENRIDYYLIIIPGESGSCVNFVNLLLIYFSLDHG